MAKVKIQLNIPAVRALRTGAPIQAELRARADRIAARADGSLSRPGHEVITHVGANRARAIVKTVTAEAKAAEASRRNLSFAINAGKG